MVDTGFKLVSTSLRILELQDLSDFLDSIERAWRLTSEIFETTATNRYASDYTQAPCQDTLGTASSPKGC